MFAPRYFAPRYFAPRYFAPSGISALRGRKFRRRRNLDNLDLERRKLRNEQFNDRLELLREKFQNDLERIKAESEQTLADIEETTHLAPMVPEPEEIRLLDRKKTLRKRQRELQGQIKERESQIARLVALESQRIANEFAVIEEQRRFDRNRKLALVLLLN